MLKKFITPHVPLPNGISRQTVSKGSKVLKSLLIENIQVRLSNFHFWHKQKELQFFTTICFLSKQ